MEVIETSLEGVLLIKPDIFSDERGLFSETFSLKKYKEFGITLDFVQDNLSFSIKNTLRGLHFQQNNPQGKLVRVVSGKVMDVVVDIRQESNNFGRYLTIDLDDKEFNQLYIPPGYAHGFLTLSEKAIFEYKCTDYYYPEDQFGLIWNDPSINIPWPTKTPLLSNQDKNFPNLKMFYNH